MAPTPAFLDFVLRHMKVTTNVCSRQVMENGYTCERRTVPDYNYIWLERGRAVWVFGEEPVEFGVGDLLVVPPGLPHNGYSITRRMTLGSIHVEPTLPGGQDVFDLLVPERKRQIDRDSRLWQYLHTSLDEWDRGDFVQTKLMLSHWGSLVTLELLRYDALHSNLHQRATDPVVAEILDELTRRVDQVTTLDELSAISGYSPQHLNRLFRKVLGVTPLQYLARMRMERAAELLAEQRWTVKAVADKLGFDDPYYFSRLFKQHFGRSPAQYRESAGSENPS